MRDTSRKLALAIAKALQVMALILLAAYSFVWAAQNLGGLSFVATAAALVVLTAVAWRTIDGFIEPRLEDGLD